MAYSLSFADYLSKTFDFDRAAIKLFQEQAHTNPVYQDFIKNLNVKTSKINHIKQIPFLPIELFKSKKVTCQNNAEIVFTSSGTTGTQTSRHYVYDINLYEQSFFHGFEYFYGPVENFCVLALLPGYLERDGSSLVYMAKKFVETSKYNESGFYLYDHEKLANQLTENEKAGIPTLLLGVTFALLDFAEQYDLNLPNTIIMETGGMKGRRKEMIREEMHAILKDGLGVKKIHSEYGMTELLSQAYSKGEGVYQTPPWMKVLTYDFYNPLSTQTQGRGGLKIIDLANRHSCAFIETQDIGEVFADGSFRVLGRFDQSDIRGCNLMVV